MKQTHTASIYDIWYSLRSLARVKAEAGINFWTWMKGFIPCLRPCLAFDRIGENQDSDHLDLLVPSQSVIWVDISDTG